MGIIPQLAEVAGVGPHKDIHELAFSDKFRSPEIETETSTAMPRGFGPPRIQRQASHLKQDFLDR